MVRLYNSRVIAAEEKFTVVGEGDGWIILDKGAPLIVHPANDRTKEPTLLGGVEKLLSYEIANGAKLSIINRLDRETSGLVLMATKKCVARELGRAMERREVKKVYYAIVHGWPEWEELTVDAPILRRGEVENSRIYVMQMVHARGKQCLTTMRVVKRVSISGRKMSLLKMSPKTGRMHQIRVHCAHVEHPIVGDKIYGGSEEVYLKFIENGMDLGMESELILPRHALHASEMSVIIGEKLEHWAIDLPTDMQNVLNH